MAANNRTASVYEDLKNKIVKGIYSPAENLPEVELAKTYSVSRNTIKKALLMLESESLVIIERNKGAKVRSYSVDEVMEYLQLRSVLEGFIVKLAVPCFTDDAIAQLQTILDKMQVARASHDLINYSGHNLQFHQVIYNVCPNRTAVNMTTALKTQMRKYNTKTILVPGRDIQSFSEHSAILDAIKNKNQDLAELLMRQHITNVRKTFAENLELLF